jgi:hypothetical protein
MEAFVVDVECRPELGVLVKESIGHARIDIVLVREVIPEEKDCR